MNKRNSAIDGLRGIAALAVVFYHSILVNGGAIVTEVLHPPVQELSSLRAVLTKIALFIFNGENAVYVFFVLSGLVLSASLQRKPVTGAVVVAFVIKRAFRIYPALIVCLALMHLLSVMVLARGGSFAGFGGWVAASRLDLIISNALLTEITVHGASWTLQAEVLAVPFILVGAILAQKLGPAGLVLALAYSLAAWQSDYLVFGSKMLAPTLPAFFLGMMLADPSSREWFRKIPSASLPITVTLFMFGRLFIPMTTDMGILAQALLATLLVGQIYHGKRDGWLSDALTSRPVQLLGRVSYSFYLFAVPVMWIGVAALIPTGLLESRPLEVGLALGFATTVATIPVAIAGERTVERWGIWIGSALARAVVGAKWLYPLGRSSRALAEPRT